MADETFEAFIARERVRLTDEREAINIQQQQLEAKLIEIAKELTAIDAYETAKYGKPLSAAHAPPPAASPQPAAPVPRQPATPSRRMRM
jgi:hypothetical protein